MNRIEGSGKKDSRQETREENVAILEKAGEIPAREKVHFQGKRGGISPHHRDPLAQRTSGCIRIPAHTLEDPKRDV
jgi:hypothetical protein